MISSKRINDIYKSNDMPVIFKFELTYEEIQQFLESVGYKTIEIDLLVTVSNIVYDGANPSNTGTKVTEMKTVILSVHKDETVPSKGEFLDNHKDKQFFDVYRKEINKKMKNIILN